MEAANVIGLTGVSAQGSKHAADDNHYRCYPHGVLCQLPELPKQKKREETKAWEHGPEDQAQQCQPNLRPQLPLYYTWRPHEQQPQSTNPLVQEKTEERADNQEIGDQGRLMF